MTISGFLPQRWRPTPEMARQAEAIAGVLHTAPLQQTAAGPAIVSLLGTTDVLSSLVAIKSLHRRLGRGRIVIVDDGTLTGEDRAILAHHFGDPEILHPGAVRHGPFPPGGTWSLLLTILDRRAGQFWIALDPHTVTMGQVPEIEAAIAGNRSFAAADGWAGIGGFAAGAAGRSFLASWVAGPERAGTVTADAAARFIIANEPQPVELTRKRYVAWRGRPLHAGGALIHFPPAHRFVGDGYVAAASATIADLPR